MPDYEEVYRTESAYFGDEPAPLLTRFADRIPNGDRVLDIGVGQGRHALFLARRGIEVVGIDRSAAAIETTRIMAEREQLPLTLWQGSFETFEPEQPFDAALVFGVLQEVSVELGQRLCEHVDRWTRPGGLLFLVAWHRDDPAFARLEQTAERIGPNSFRLPGGEVRTYLEPGEILERFAAWTPVHHVEGLSPEHRHGDGPPERHGWVELLAQKPIA